MICEVIHLRLHPEQYFRAARSIRFNQRPGWAKLVMIAMDERYEAFVTDPANEHLVMCENCGQVLEKRHLAEALLPSSDPCQAMQSPEFYECSCGQLMHAETGECGFGGCGQCRGCAG